ncbi:glycoside hydrolase family 127 protein [Candidatus Poribacteria bacterium]|nr:glycoside hydrolase family 127 protein [Candidatus Poribacteria bacterium]
MNKKDKTLKALPFTDVTIKDRFWSPRQTTNSEKTIPHELEQCRTTGRINNFAKAAGLMEGNFEGIFFNDSDVHKLVEAASYTLKTHPNPEWEAELDEVIDTIAKSQQADGYLNSYFTLVEPQKRWQNLGMMHELYCAGHLFEAGVAHYQATGKQKLLDVACRFADLIDNTFGHGKRDGLPGHQGIELALVKLARVTGEARYMSLAEYFVTKRGHSPHVFEKELENPDLPGGLGAYQHHYTRDEKYEGTYSQAHKPLKEQTECVGHAVRAMYLYAGAADIALETGDTDISNALGALWENVEKRLYVTGGVGPSGHNEGFTQDYELPNFSAYAETCASIGLIFWAHRMFLLKGESRFIDVLETALYNGALSGISLDGTGFFYQNPLASRGERHRHAWFGCACCPPNIARLLGSLGQYIYAQSENDLWVNLYVGGTASATVAGDVSLQLTQETDYPWSGDVRITVDPEKPAKFALNLRIPSWCNNFKVNINGESHSGKATSNGYLSIVRQWHANDTVELNLDMPVARIYAHPYVRDNLGRSALRRGPLVYCFEDVDNPDGAFETLSLIDDAAVEAVFNSELLGGITLIRSTGTVFDASEWENSLYHPKPSLQRMDITAIPYYAWCNREAGQMAVWVF